MQFLHAYLQSKPLEPKTILIALPSYMKFPDIDGLILYQGSSMEVQFKVYAYQAKTKRGCPRYGVPKEIDRCFLLRGSAPSRPFQRDKWYYVEESVMKELLGYSLQPFYPTEWGNINETAEDGFD